MIVNCATMSMLLSSKAFRSSALLKSSFAKAGGFRSFGTKFNDLERVEKKDNILPVRQDDCNNSIYLLCGMFVMESIH